MTDQISVVVPVYNEEHNIALLYDRVVRVLNGMDLSYEIIFINDGSSDRSLEMIRQLAVRDTCVKFIDFSRNFGHQIAVSAGLDVCSGQHVVIIDSDLQDPPELITDLLNRKREGFEVVYAKRRSRQGESVLKKATARSFYRLLQRITNVPIPVDTGDFRIIDRSVVEVLKQMPEQEKFLRGQIAWAGFRQTYIEYDRDSRNAGKTGYTFRKMFRLALDGITGFSNLPLKFATIAGFLVSGIAFLMALYALYSRFIIKEYVPGWTSLMLTILFLGGVQLISIGIIGEYISRLGNNIRKRPLYVVSDTNISTFSSSALGKQEH